MKEKRLRKGIRRKLEREKRENRTNSQKKILQEIAADLPREKNIIERKIQEAIDFAKKYNPVNLLDIITYHNKINDYEQYHEYDFKGKENNIEYCLSLITALSDPGKDHHVPGGEVEKFISLIEDICLRSTSYLGFKIILEGGHGKKINFILSRRLSSYLNIRGDSYAHHHEDLLRGIFLPVNDFLTGNLGYGIDDIFNLLKEIQEQIQDSFQKKVESFKINHPVFNLLSEVKGGNIEIESDFENRIEKIQITQEENDDLFLETMACFEINLEKITHKKILKDFSLNIGENDRFLSREKGIPAFPLNPSLIYEKPFIQHLGHFYSHGQLIFSRNLKYILENFIQTKDKDFFDNKYSRRRAKYLEEETKRCYQAIFPGYHIYTNLFYTMKIDGKVERCELDGLILFDNNLILYECKAANFSKPARRGAMNSLKEALKATIDGAYNQAVRAKEFIKNCKKNVAKFFDKKGILIVEIDPGKIDHYILNTVTLECYGFLSTELHNLLHFNLLRGKEWPWSVFINDLRIISEINQTPSQFISYLKRRVMLNVEGKVSSSDELEYYMCFLKNNFGDINGKADIYVINGFVDDLDQYYNYQMGLRSAYDKPKLNRPDRVMEIIKELETKGKEKFSEVTSLLISINGEEVLEKLDKMISQAKNDGRHHNAVMGWKEIQKYLNIVALPREDQEIINKMKGYSLLKKYHLHSDCFITLIFIIEDNSYRHEVLDWKWKFDGRMEQLVDSSGLKKLNRRRKGFSA